MPFTVFFFLKFIQLSKPLLTMSLSSQNILGNFKFNSIVLSTFINNGDNKIEIRN